MAVVVVSAAAIVVLTLEVEATVAAVIVEYFSSSNESGCSRSCSISYISQLPAQKHLTETQCPYYTPQASHDVCIFCTHSAPARVHVCQYLRAQQRPCVSPRDSRHSVTHNRSTAIRRI